MPEIKFSFFQGADFHRKCYEVIALRMGSVHFSWRPRKATGVLTKKGHFALQLVLPSEAHGTAEKE